MRFRPKYVQMKAPLTRLEQFRLLPGVQDLIAFRDRHGIAFPILTNSYFAGLINPKHRKDPIRSLILPTKQELLSYMEGASQENGCFDTSGESINVKAPGLQHKYTPTALALISNACAGLCRECFRKRLFIKDANGPKETTFPNDDALEYLREHREINTILLSGGDALMLANDSIKELLSYLDSPQLNHLRTVRFGTTVAAFYPQRIDEELCAILADFSNRSGKSVHVCVHYEHPRELTEQSIGALELMRSHGIEMYNQTVLLAGINDDAQVLHQLFEKLAKHGVRPYYLFQCRPVMGSRDMQVKLADGVRIVEELNQMTTGIHKVRYAMSTPGGKMEILGLNPRNSREVVLRYHSAKQSELTGNLVFYDPSKCNPYWFEPEDVDIGPEFAENLADSQSI